MPLLIAGVCLWAAIHLVPSLAPGLKSAWRGKLGEGGYKGSFTLIVLSALALIIVGWRSAQPTLIYLPPEALRTLALALMVLAFILLGASKRATRIGRIVRHPQLSGVLVWSVAHLLANGDSRSLVLFGGFAIWTVLEMILISRR
ncbi:MAG: NnrU family protein, partial [Gammaproteobacteria bacterium]|nr:NnrU family protein [Gammaproteobacteria bacterium]